MAMFGNSVPGFGGGMFPVSNPLQVPDYMAGINDAFAQNATQQVQPKKKGIGDFLKAFAGTYGDSLTGNPAYARHMAAMQEQQQQQEDYERQRRDAIADYEAKKQVDAKYSAPDLPGLLDEYETGVARGHIPQGTPFLDYVKIKNPGAFVPPSPVSVPYGATVTGGDAPPGGAPAGMPQVRNEQEYNALPPGTAYTDPNGIVRKKGGQSGAGPAGGFSGPY